MLAQRQQRDKPQQGTTMLEVLVTIVILAFGMLGLAGLQSKIFLTEMESYQRAQAIVLMNDMVERVNSDRVAAAAGSYIPTTNLGCAPQCPPGETTYGTASDQPADCSAKAAGVARNLCEWSNALKGAAETSGAAQKVGGMLGALGCITQIQPQDLSAGVCKPQIYLVSVVWQGLNATTSPAATCGQNGFGNDDRYRRAVSTRVSIGAAGCQ